MDHNSTVIFQSFRRISSVIALAVSLLFCGQLVMSITSDLQNQVAIELSDMDNEPEEEKDDKEEEKFKQSSLDTNMLSEALKARKLGNRFKMNLADNHHPENLTPPPEVIQA